MTTVKFVRKNHKDLAHSVVYVGGQPLKFKSDEAEIDLKSGEVVDVYWRIQGKPGASFSLRAEYDGKKVKLADSYSIPKKKDRKSDFAFLKV